MRFVIPLENITSKFGFSSPSARKPVKPRFCSALHNFTVIPWHILRVLLTFYGKMAQEWANKAKRLAP